MGKPNPVFMAPNSRPPHDVEMKPAMSVADDGQEPPLQQGRAWLILIGVCLVFIAVLAGSITSGFFFIDSAAQKVPGRSIPQLLVVFASVLSFLFVATHILAVQRGNRLYPPSRQPQYPHIIHSWAALLRPLSCIAWCFAIALVTGAIYYRQGQDTSAYLDVDMWACATGVFSTILLELVIACTSRPYRLPRLRRATVIPSPSRTSSKKSVRSSNASTRSGVTTQRNLVVSELTDHESGRAVINPGGPPHQRYDLFLPSPISSHMPGEY